MTRSTFEHTRPHDYLRRLAASDLGQAYMSLGVSELQIRRGDVVVDLGCGPGTDLPGFAEATGTGGLVIGLDHDDDVVDQANTHTAALSQVRVRHCDVHTLDLADGSVYRIHTDRVLQHVSDPARVLAEARRVLRPGSRAVFAELDWDALVIDYPDLAVARAYTRFVAEQVIRNVSATSMHHSRCRPSITVRNGSTNACGRRCAAKPSR